MDAFVHIPKTGGSTIRSIASRQYGVDKILLFEPGSQAWLDDASGRVPLPDQVEARHTALITGHNPFGVHARLKRPARYFAFVRDPIDRYISEYHTAGIHVDHRLRRAVTEEGLTLDAFFANSLLAPGDIMARFLAGVTEPEPVEVSTVMANVENTFAVVGLAERFDESILLTARSLGWDVPLYILRNVGQPRVASVDLRKEEATRLRRAHGDRFAVDLALHRAVDALLTRRVEGEGAAFQDALGSFRDLEQAILNRQGTDRYRGYGLQGRDALPAFVADLTRSSAYATVRDYLAAAPLSAGNPLVSNRCC